MRIDNPTITKIPNLTSNGFLQTSGGDGTLGIQTSLTETDPPFLTLLPGGSAFGHTASTPGNASRITRGTHFGVRIRGAQITGAYFYTGETGSHTIAISLWAVVVAGQAAGTQLATTTSTVTGPGFFSKLFSTAYTVADADIVTGRFHISYCEQTPPAGAGGYGDTYVTPNSVFLTGMHYPGRAYFLYDRTSWNKYPGNNVYTADADGVHSSPIDPIIVYGSSGGW